MPKTRQPTRTNAWEVWSRDSYYRGHRYESENSFVAAFKDKRDAQERMRSLKRSHPDVTYYLKHRKVERHMQFGSRRARRRSSKKWGLALA